MSFLTRASLKNRLIIGIITVAIAVLGVFSMGSIKQELMPTLQSPMAQVAVTSPGLAPDEMATTITEPMEQALQSVSGLTDVTSTTMSGDAYVTVQWPFENDGDETLRAIRAAAEGLKSTFPDGTEVNVYTGGTDDTPAMVLSAGSDEDQTVFGDALTQKVVPALQSIPGVGKVTLGGVDEQRILIDLRPTDVSRLKVDTSQLQSVLEAHGATVPAGEAESDEGSLSVTVGTAITSIDDIKALAIPTEDGVSHVSDFADVHSEAAPATSLSRVNGKPALTLQIMAAQGANVVDVSHRVTAELDRQAASLKAEFVTVFDQAPFIEQSIHDLSVEGGLGLLFAVLVILAFLGSWRSTIIAALSIPLSLLITLIGLWWSDNTLNILTLGALTIAIGRVVDDSIVVIENISRRRSKGPLTIDGVVASVRQVAGAITASTLTTVAVFLPIAFVSGVAGQLFRPFAITVTIALLASLLVALTAVPVFAYWFMRRTPARIADAAGDQEAADDGSRAGSTAGAESDAESDAESGAESEHDDLAEIHTAPDRLQRAVMPALNATRRHPVITLVTAGAILIATLAMGAFIRTDFLGSSGNESLQLTQTPKVADADDADGNDDAEGEDGASAQNADLVSAAEPVEAAIESVTGVSDVMTTIPLAASGEPVQITYDVKLDDGADAEQVGGAVEKAVDELPDADTITLDTQDASLGDAGGSGIDLQIRGNDPEALRKASEQLEKELGDADGVKSVKSELAGEQPVMRVKLDEDRAAKLGFDRATVARTVQEALQGQSIGELMLDGQNRSILVRTPGSERTADRLGEIMLPVTAQQTAEAQKQASQRLEDKAKAEADQQQAEADAELAEQIDTAASQRAELVTQIGELNAQLTQLSSAPVVPEAPRTPAEDAELRAQQERAEQIAGLQGAIESAQSGIESMDEQIAALRESQTQSAQQIAEQQASEEEQKAAAEATGTAIPLSNIAKIERELTPPVINRSDGNRQVALTVTPRAGELEAATAAVDDAIATTDLPAGVSFELGGASAEQDEAFAQLGAAMLAAILLVLMVMVAMFRSFRGPFVLLVSIPFAATGAILGLLLTNTPLGLPALIGLLMLIGIVVTNAIVLMDLVNRLRASGATLDEAVEHGTRLRLRPILMTAAATIFALIPMSLGLTGGGVFISKPLAIVVIGGLISSTVLTLVLVPVLYTLVERRRERKLVKRAARAGRRAERRAATAADRAAQRAIKRGRKDRAETERLADS